MNQQKTIGKSPDVPELSKWISGAISDAGTYIAQRIRDYDTRFCLWDNQAADGRKWKREGGKEPFPWDGASDARIRTADEVVQEQVTQMLIAWRRGRIQVSARNPMSATSAMKAQAVIDWLFRTAARRRINAAVELAAQYRQTHGAAVLYTGWEIMPAVTSKTIDLRAVAGLAAEARAAGDPQGDALAAQSEEFAALLADPLRAEEAEGAMAAMFPDISRAKVRALLRQIRDTGSADWPVVTVGESLPHWRALRLWADVFWPADTEDEQNARWIAMREPMSETEMRGRARSEGWDEKWLEEAAEKKGATTALGTGADDLNKLSQNGANTGGQDKDRIEVWHMWYRGIDAETGAPAIFRTVFHADIQGKAAWHGLSPYWHGKLPFVALVRERIDHAAAESRGVPEIAATEQSAIKAQVDARTDVTSLSTCPPVSVPLWRAKTKLKFGPGTQNAERRPGELRWMPPPPNDGRSREIEESAHRRVNRYFARWSETVPPTVSGAASQHLIDAFLEEMAEAAAHTIKLAQQFIERTTVEKIVGGMPVGWEVSREDIAGDFQFQILFDARDLNLDFVIAKAKTVNELILPADTLGVVDRANWIAVAMSWIDPWLAEQVVRSPQAATESEVADERNNFAMMMAGVEPKMIDKGQNFALRLQTLQTILQANPVLPQILQGRPDVQAMLQARVKHLQFGMQQAQNAATGRAGAEPGLETLSGQAMAAGGGRQ